MTEKVELLSIISCQEKVELLPTFSFQESRNSSIFSDWEKVGKTPIISCQENALYI